MTISNGYVFDIKRFAMHDGQGIRSTVFLKGCPLRCAWCQNPEGLLSRPQVLYMSNNCIHCQSCVQASKCGGVKAVGNHIVLDRSCKEDWNEITDACPTRALRFDATEMTVEDVVDQIMRDKAFFKYGGGATISGGEPFNQFEFMLAILKACKEQGIHTTIESSLFVDQQKLITALPYIDSIYCDLKAFNNDEHFAFTRVNNDIILNNIRYLLQSDKKDEVIVRTPLIPEMTATKHNIASISKFLSECYSNVQYEMLNYNPLAKAKYSYLDMEYCFEENPKLYTKDQMNEFYNIARANGIVNLIIE